MNELLVILKFANRKLSIRELEAWQRRRQHPKRLALVFIAAVTVLVAAMVWGIALMVYLIDGPHALNPGHYFTFNVITFLFGPAIGVVLFLFWYSNGVALYKKQMDEVSKEIDKDI